MSSEELITTASYAERLGVKAFLLRGACTLKLLASDEAQPLPGGRHRIDEEGKGRQAQLSKLAARIGVTSKTLRTDARIYDISFKDNQTGKTRNARVLSLPREIFVIALSAPDPQTAIEFALEQTRQQPFGRQQFREYIQGINYVDGSASQTRALEKEKRIALPRRLSPEAERALVDLQEMSGQKPATILAEALLSYHATLRRNSRKSQFRTRRPAKPRDKSSAADPVSAQRSQTLIDKQSALF